MNDATWGVSAPATGGRGVLEGAFAILEVLSCGAELGLTPLAAAAGIPKATSYRLLNQLVDEGAVLRRDGRYQLGPRLFRLGQTWQPAKMLRAAAAHPLGQLTSVTDRGGYSLAVAERGQCMLIGGVGREIDEVFPLRAGVLLPPGTAAEQVLFAGKPNGAVPAGFSHREWQRMRIATRDQGVAFDTDMSRFDLACVAAPVRDPSGTVVAALAATVREQKRVGGAAEAVRRAADLVTANLGRLMKTHAVRSPA
ncbi:helix-turn-helix domain-containing protein [Nocardia sp. NPDC051832]|uniref:IclR family transcriptional regulator n=1 Tax=Nocardia sp. NPDC051832 TaxID=3155673 RepID=UPI00343EC656